MGTENRIHLSSIEKQPKEILFNKMLNNKEIKKDIRQKLILFMSPYLDSEV